MQYAASLPFHGDTDRAFGLAESALTAIGFRLTERTAVAVEFIGPGMNSSREVALVGASRIRGHWCIENTLHWTLDVIFAEDRSRIRTGNGPEIASIFRKLALLVLQQDTTSKGSLRGKRLQAGWNEDFLERLLCSFAED